MGKFGIHAIALLMKSSASWDDFNFFYLRPSGRQKILPPEFGLKLVLWVVLDCTYFDSQKFLAILVLFCLAFSISSQENSDTDSTEHQLRILLIGFVDK